MEQQIKTSLKTSSQYYWSFYCEMFTYLFRKNIEHNPFHPNATARNWTIFRENPADQATLRLVSITSRQLRGNHIRHDGLSVYVFVCECVSCRATKLLSR